MGVGAVAIGNGRCGLRFAFTTTRYGGLIGEVFGVVAVSCITRSVGSLSRRMAIGGVLSNTTGRMTSVPRAYEVTFFTNLLRRGPGARGRAIRVVHKCVHRGGVSCTGLFGSVRR